MSSSDKKLLILAAKAAGIELSYGKVPYTSFDGLAKGWKDWNPLSDDGDALRLAVRLGLWVDVRQAGMSDEPVAVVGYSKYDTKKQVREYDHEDHYAATRRAIVRAAAEIGRTMG